MRIYDRDRQEWVGREQEQAIAVLHDRDATRQRAARRGVVVVLAVCGLAFGTWALGWKDEPPSAVSLTERQPEHGAGADGTDGTGTTGGTDGTDGTEGTGGTGDTGTEDAAPPSSNGGPPSGYDAFHHDEGFRVAVPKDWGWEQEDSQHGIDIVNFSNEDRSRRLQVYEVSEPSPMASLQTFLDETEIPKSPGFTQLDLTTPAGPRPAARLTYLTSKIAGEPDHGPWHVVDHRFEAEDGKIYALAAYGSESDGRQDERELLATALEWFCPPSTYCSEPGSD